MVSLVQRKKAAAAAEKQKAQEKKEHEEWLASMDEETRARYIAEQERKQRYVSRARVHALLLLRRD